MKNNTRRLKTFGAIFIIVVCSFMPNLAVATMMYDNRASWESGVASFAEVNISILPNLSIVVGGTPISMPSGETVSFSVDLERVNVGDGWGSWSGGNTPNLFWTMAASSIVGSFSTPQWAFGVEMEPNVYHYHDMTMTLSDGSFLTQSVTGDAGAEFFGWIGGPITSITLTDLNEIENNDFAFGRMVQLVSIPLPPSIFLLGPALLGLIFLRKRH